MTKKHAYQYIAPIADKIADRLRPYCDCDQIIVAGSIRRQEPAISDVELVAIPKIDRVTAPTLFPGIEGVVHTRNYLLTYLDQLLSDNVIEAVVTHGRVCWGEKQRKFNLKTSNQGRVVKVDLFLCDRGNWGNTVVIRSGPSEFSKFLVTADTDGGVLPAGMTHKNNRLYRHDQPIEIETEAAFFEAVGLPFVPVEARSRLAWRVDEIKRLYGHGPLRAL